MMLTIAVITRKRPEFLFECLLSIYEQSVNNFCVLIVDNDDNKSALPVYNHFSELNTIPIIYKFEPMPGYSRARNCALNSCDTRFIGFVDDDCILDECWAERGMTAILQYQSAFIVGRSIENESGKLFAAVEKYCIYDITKASFYNKETLEIRFEKLDTKNLIMDNKLLKTYNISFDERFNLRGGEDVDLGLQIKHKKLKGYYIENMLVYHKEKTSYRKFLHKAFCYGYSGYNLYDKWHYKNECRGWAKYTWFRFWNIASWLHSFLYALLKLKRRTFFRIAYFFFLARMFNRNFLKGALESKKILKGKTAGRNTEYQTVLRLTDALSTLFERGIVNKINYKE